jgi:hypothetical protein
VPESWKFLTQLYFPGVEVIYISVPDHPTIELIASGFHLTIGTILPFSIITISNIIIITTVRQASKQRLKLESKKTTTNADVRQKKEIDYLTRMLIFVCAAYIITSIPLRLYYLYLDIPAFGSKYDMSDTYWNFRYNIELIFLFEFWSCNYAINFYVYCIGGGKRYRDDTKAVIKSFLTCASCRKDVLKESSTSTASRTFWYHWIPRYFTTKNFINGALYIYIYYRLWFDMRWHFLFGGHLGFLDETLMVWIYWNFSQRTHHPFENLRVA